MRELLDVLDEWSSTDPAVALATVVRTSGSTPRPVGARLAITADQRLAGSVSGGCLEADVVEEAMRTLSGEQPARILHYGISDEMGFSVGLSCGGSVDVLIEAWRWDAQADAVVARLGEALRSGDPVALVSLVDGEHAGARALVDGDRLVGTLGSAEADAVALSLGLDRIDTGMAALEERDGMHLYVEPFVARPHLVVIGASDIGAALTTMAQTCGYQVTVVDPRTAFLTRERFPTAEVLIARWPDEALAGLTLGPRDAAACLSHDPKFDEPTLDALLAGEVGYIGAIGSRRTAAKRVERLRVMGHSDEAIGRVHSPVGLDIGSRTPAEIALSILAEAVATRRGRTGASLREPVAAAAAPG